jgi:hypothetical protein
VVLLIFFQAPPFGVPPLAQDLQLAFFPPAVQDQADGFAADNIRRMLKNIFRYILKYIRSIST